MSHRPSLRLQVTAVFTVFAFLMATMPQAGATPAKATPAKAAPAQNPHRGSTPALVSLVQATATSGGTAAGVFSGILSVTGFSVVNGVLNATGTVAGLLTPTGGTAQTIAPQSFTVPVAAIDPSCGILTLTLGPLNLNLLGLTVSLNQVLLTVTAVAGAGNLLGNLLCDVANLLNSGSALSTLLGDLTTTLNNILSAL